jgi:hypothetical protein
LNRPSSARQPASNKEDVVASTLNEEEVQLREEEGPQTSLTIEEDPIAPKFTYPLHDKTVILGEKTSLKCQVSFFDKSFKVIK